ncbi:hypothetical protein ACJRO7_015600, partial [Eucalyptus globulus]
NEMLEAVSKMGKKLKSGVVVNFEDDQLWVDSKYQRLPYFCYSYERIGHYTISYKEGPYKEPKPKENGSGSGYLLKVEAQEISPFWKLFYGKEFPVPEEEEIVPETARLADIMKDIVSIENDKQQMAKPMEIQLVESSKPK